MATDCTWLFAWMQSKDAQKDGGPSGAGPVSQSSANKRNIQIPKRVRNDPSLQRKVALMGFRAVGKTSVTMQFVEERFTDQYSPTIGNTFQKILKHNGQDFFTDIVDTAGQDEYAIITNQHSVGIHGYVLIYSVTNRQSFEMVKIINEKILDLLGTEKVPRVLVGNKIDLDNRRVVTTEEGQKLSDDWGCAFIECSAKENNNISDVFALLFNEIDKEAGVVEKKKESGCTIL